MFKPKWRGGVEEELKKRLLLHSSQEGGVPSAQQPMSLSDITEVQNDQTSQKNCIYEFNYVKQESYPLKADNPLTDTNNSANKTKTV